MTDGCRGDGAPLQPDFFYAGKDDIMAIKELPIKDIVIDPAMQHREVDASVVARYKALMADGVKFPPVNIVNDGNNNYLWDGAHRKAALLKLGKKYIACNIENGSRRDALFFSFSANKANAFPRQPGTVKGIIEKMLKDEEWSKMPIRGIADWAGCTERYVQQIQADLKRYGVNCSPHRPDSKPKNEVSRAKTRKVQRGESEYEMQVPEKKTLDSTGKQVPEHLIKYFERANEYRQMIRELNTMLKTVRDGKNVGDLFYKYIKIENLTAEIGNVKRIFRFAMPYAVCRYCGGDENNAECRDCNGDGFVNESLYITTHKDLK